MRRSRWISRPAFALLGPLLAAQETAEWSQWGGPRRDFRLPARDLAETWPDGGPPVVWSRALGGGYGGIAVAGSTLFTLVRRGDEDLAVALDCADGSTRWLHEMRAVPRADLDYGAGPFATPVVTTDAVFLLGGTGLLRAHRRVDGELLWSRDLDRDFAGPRPDRGWAPSPILVGGALILPAGAPGAAVVALDPRDGTTLWRRHDFDFDYAAPIVVTVGDSRQLVCHMEAEVIGLDPSNGRLLWSIPSPSDRTQHVIAPVDLGGGDVLVSTTQAARRLRLGGPRPEVVWSSRRIRAQVGNLLSLPDENVVLGPSSASTGALLVALDADSGETLWRDRGIDCGFLWSIGDRVLGLARDGELVLARASRDGLAVSARCQPFTDDKVWSAPAMSGTKLFLKDQTRIVALELGR